MCTSELGTFEKEGQYQKSAVLYCIQNEYSTVEFETVKGTRKSN